MVGLQLRHKGMLGAVLGASLAVTPKPLSRVPSSTAVKGGGTATSQPNSRSSSVPTDNSEYHHLRHYIITPTNTAVATLVAQATARQQSRGGLRGEKAAASNDTAITRTTTNFIPPIRIRVEDLNGDELCTMLRMAVAMTSPDKAYTFHAVGHHSSYCGGSQYGGNTMHKETKATSVASSTSTPSPANIPAFTNAAVLHVVGREEGDLPINNIIYTNLIHKCSVLNVATSLCGVTDGKSGGGYHGGVALSTLINADSDDNSNKQKHTTTADVTKKTSATNVFEERVQHYLPLTGAATLDNPHPNSDMASKGPEGDALRALVAVDAKTTFATDAERRTAYSAFVAALQRDAKTGNDLETVLPAHPLHTNEGSDQVAEATRENLIQLADASKPPQPRERTFHFWPYKCDYRSAVAYESNHFVVLVNLKPVTKGHLMVVPRRVMPTIHGLNHAEISEWGFIVKHCCLVLRKVYPECQGISLAIQQGKAAGQTVPHLHTHLIVYREAGELDGEPEPEEEEQIRRRPRTHEEMQAESDFLRKVFLETEPLVAEEAVLFSSL